MPLEDILEDIEQRNPVHVYNVSLNPPYQDRLGALTPARVPDWLRDTAIRRHHPSYGTPEAAMAGWEGMFPELPRRRGDLTPEFYRSAPGRDLRHLEYNRRLNDVGSILERIQQEYPGKTKLVPFQEGLFTGFPVKGRYDNLFPVSALTKDYSLRSLTPRVDASTIALMPFNTRKDFRFSPRAREKYAGIAERNITPTFQTDSAMHDSPQLFAGLLRQLDKKFYQKNKAYLLHDRGIVGRVQKTTSPGEDLEADTAYAPGHGVVQLYNRYGSYQDRLDRALGVSICSDHANWKNSPPPALRASYELAPHLRFILSDSSDPRSEKPWQAPGATSILVSADPNPRYKGVHLPDPNDPNNKPRIQTPSTASFVSPAGTLRADHYILPPPPSVDIGRPARGRRVVDLPFPGFADVPAPGAAASPPLGPPEAGRAPLRPPWQREAGSSSVRDLPFSGAGSSRPLPPDPWQIGGGLARELLSSAQELGPEALAAVAAAALSMPVSSRSQPPPWAGRALPPPPPPPAPPFKRGGLIKAYSKAFDRALDCFREDCLKDLKKSSRRSSPFS